MRGSFVFLEAMNLKGTHMKTSTQVRRLIEFDPTVTNSQIAIALGISRQLVGYHVTKLKLPRSTPNRSCNSCGKRIGRYNGSGLCKDCRPMAFAYEFICAYCRKINVVTGRKATNRRRSKLFKKSTNDFCDLRCSKKFFWSK